MAKRYYIAMAMCQNIKINDASGEECDIPVIDNDHGIAGYVPIFTNKKKARKWAKDIREIRLGDERHR